MATTSEENVAEMIQNASTVDVEKQDEPDEEAKHSDTIAIPHSGPHISIFKPLKDDENKTITIESKGDLTKKKVEDLIDSNWKTKLRPKITRVVATLILSFLAMSLIAWTDADFHVTKSLSLTLATMFTIYFGHVWYLIMRSDKAYRIYSLSSPVEGWTPMPITYRALEYKTDSIGSISEFSAIGGGIANQMLLAIGIITSTSILIQEINNVWFEKIWLSFTNNLLCNSC
eukprot:99861_1